MIISTVRATNFIRCICDANSAGAIFFLCLSLWKQGLPQLTRKAFSPAYQDDICPIGCFSACYIAHALTAKIPHSYLLLLLTSAICKKAMRKGSYTKLCFDCPRFPTDKRGMLMSFLLFLSGIQACPNKKTYQAISFLISSSMLHFSCMQRPWPQYDSAFSTSSFSSCPFHYAAGTA